MHQATKLVFAIAFDVVAISRQFAGWLTPARRNIRAVLMLAVLLFGS
jgi:hypothetical protein